MLNLLYIGPTVKGVVGRANIYPPLAPALFACSAVPQYLHLPCQDRVALPDVLVRSAHQASQPRSGSNSWSPSPRVMKLWNALMVTDTLTRLCVCGGGDGAGGSGAGISGLYHWRSGSQFRLHVPCFRLHKVWTTPPRGFEDLRLHWFLLLFRLLVNLWCTSCCARSIIVNRLFSGRTTDCFSGLLSFAHLVPFCWGLLVRALVAACGRPVRSCSSPGPSWTPRSK